MQVQSVDFDFHLSMPESVFRINYLFLMNIVNSAVMIFVINKPLGSILNKFLSQIPIISWVFFF